MTATLADPVVIAQRDLRNDSGAYLRRVQAGEAFLVTIRGVPVAKLIPVPEPPAPRTDRVPARPARRHGGWDEIPMVARDLSVQDNLDYQRGDR